jgi:putative hydrolase
MGRLINRRNKRYAILADKLLETVPPWDYHIHTSFTDGEASIDEIVQYSIELGLARIIFTEHTEPWFAKLAGWFDRYLEQIRSSKEKYKNKIEILIGLEAPATDYDTGLGITPEMEKEVDFLLGCAHRYPEMLGKKVRNLTNQEAIELENKTLMALAHNPRIDSIAHIGATCNKYCCPFPMDLTREIIRTATHSGIAIEINQAYQSSLSEFIKICIEEKAFCTLGSNAHALKEIGQAYKAVVNLKI